MADFVTKMLFFYHSQIAEIQYFYCLSIVKMFFLFTLPFYSSPFRKKNELHHT